MSGILRTLTLENRIRGDEPFAVLILYSDTVMVGELKIENMSLIQKELVLEFTKKWEELLQKEEEK